MLSVGNYISKAKLYCIFNYYFHVFVANVFCISFGLSLIPSRTWTKNLKFDETLRFANLTKEI